MSDPDENLKNVRVKEINKGRRNLDFDLDLNRKCGRPIMKVKVDREKGDGDHKKCHDEKCDQ